MTLPRSSLIAALLLTAGYAGLLAAMDFHLCLNDFWAWSFLASRMDLADPSTLHNGFMPPAYALLLKAVGPSREIAVAFAFSLLSVFIAAMATIRISARLGVGPWAVGLLALFPPFLQGGLTAGPDIVVTALVTVAVALHFRRGVSGGRSLAAGALLGLALMVRSHALFAGLALAVARIAVDRRFGRGDVWLLVGIGAGVAGQGVLNLVAGEPAWATDQAFNVYKMVHGMDWYAPVDPATLSVVDIVRDAPGRFVTEWAGAILRAGAWALGPALLWVLTRRRDDARTRFAGFAVVGAVLYTVPVALGDSPRTAVVISALFVPSAAALLAELRARDVSLPRVLSAAVLAFGLVASLRADFDFLRHNFRQARDFAAVESALADAGATGAEQVFTDDFDLYFRDLEGRRPLTRGGWGSIGIDGWAEEFAQLPTGDVSRFLAAARAHGVRYLALTRKSRRIGDDFATFYYDPAALGAPVLAECGEFRVVRLPPPSPTP